MIKIIGSGWYGCYLGLKFKEMGIEFEILEKNSEIFLGSSGYNQNRLHQGFHYPRDYSTRKTSMKGFERFEKEFHGLTLAVKKNIYAVHKESYIDFQTYLSIYSHENYNFKIISDKSMNSFVNYEGLIAVEERLINFKKSKQFFLDLGLPIKYNTLCSYNGLDIFANGNKITSDLIFDCTYGQMSCPNGFYTEDFLSFVYKKKNDISFDALTVMNGEFYSIYPYYDDLYTVTGVKEGIVDLSEYNILGDEKYISKRRNLLECKILKDYRTFLLDFEYSTFFISKKTKPKCNTDKRATDFIFNRNIYTICSGKIDTIFELDLVFASIDTLQKKIQNVICY